MITSNDLYELGFIESNSSFKLELNYNKSLIIYWLDTPDFNIKIRDEEEEEEVMVRVEPINRQDLESLIHVLSY